MIERLSIGEGIHLQLQLQLKGVGNMERGRMKEGPVIHSSIHSGGRSDNKVESDCQESALKSAGGCMGHFLIPPFPPFPLLRTPSVVL